MAVQSGSTIYASDVDSYLGVTKGNPIYASDVNKIIENLNKSRVIGGKIFYDAGDNGATYTFYNSSGNVITDTSISGLQNAVSYRVEGIPTKDRFYVVFPNLLNSGESVYWGFYYNADIESSYGNIVNTGTGIGTGKTATQAILNYIDTYASNETANTDKPSSEISQSSHTGYNLYKNCGTNYKYLWDIVRESNNNFIGGLNDWFIPSNDELQKISDSRVISNILKKVTWSSSSYSNPKYAQCLNYSISEMIYVSRNNGHACVICRSF